tara:strand:- start:15816 stop:16646 length:831 start_codon:yes stop_codon:yes gene_type:complete
MKILLLAAVITLPLTGCGGSKDTKAEPEIPDLPLPVPVHCSDSTTYNVSVVNGKDQYALTGNTCNSVTNVIANNNVIEMVVAPFKSTDWWYDESLVFTDEYMDYNRENSYKFRFYYNDTSKAYSLYSDKELLGNTYLQANETYQEAYSYAMQLQSNAIVAMQNQTQLFKKDTEAVQEQERERMTMYDYCLVLSGEDIGVRIKQSSMIEHTSGAVPTARLLSVNSSIDISVTVHVAGQPRFTDYVNPWLEGQNAYSVTLDGGVVPLGIDYNYKDECQ